MPYHGLIGPKRGSLRPRPDGYNRRPSIPDRVPSSFQDLRALPQEDHYGWRAPDDCPSSDRGPERLCPPGRSESEAVRHQRNCATQLAPNGSRGRGRDSDHDPKRPGRRPESANGPRRSSHRPRRRAVGSYRARRAAILVPVEQEAVLTTLRVNRILMMMGAMFPPKRSGCPTLIAPSRRSI